ncbi:sugar transferase [Erythrobacter litoralis]|uniref:sugar transferase n=1 Tax=Erythrobacter litoralis TaxID=39960 RepID=UPI002435F6A5|nr:sugar transferase [Erythrobacter litoralis]
MAPRYEPAKKAGIRGADARFAAFLLLGMLDLGALWAGSLVAFDLAGRNSELPSGFALLSVSYLLVAALSGAFSRQALLAPILSVIRGVRSTLTATAGLWVVAVLADVWDPGDTHGIVLGCGIAMVLLFAGRITLAVLSNLVAAQFSNDLLIVDDVEPASIPDRYTVVGSAKLGMGADDRIGSIGFSRITKLAAKADRILVSCSAGRRRFWSDLFDTFGVDAAVIVSDIRQISAVDKDFDTYLPILRVSRGPLVLRQRIVKRLFDLAIAVPLFVILTPVLAAVWIGLATQTRKRKVTRSRTFFGIRNQPFRSHVFVAPDPSGRKGVLYRTGLFRLPMLLDVILGRMSIVGPTPVELKPGSAQHHMRRNVKPGLFEPRVEANGSSYREGWTLWRDIASLARLNPSRPK